MDRNISANLLRTVGFVAMSPIRQLSICGGWNHRRRHSWILRWSSRWSGRGILCRIVCRSICGSVRRIVCRIVRWSSRWTRRRCITRRFRRRVRVRMAVALHHCTAFRFCTREMLIVELVVDSIVDATKWREGWCVVIEYQSWDTGRCQIGRQINTVPFRRMCKVTDTCR